ncbi:Glucuronosyltransferase [Aphelenchoides besseyi]|nr:Glucuronosyltransferase [Aphelenchoides besseyi]KAI6200229.1 Glucuronosyltransferase [Aphelenchoides besseyi]
MTINLTTLFVLIFILIPELNGTTKKQLKILVHSPNMGFSHLAFQGKLADLLVEAKHEVHVYIPDWEPKEQANGTFRAHKIVRFQSKNPESIKPNPHFANPFNINAQDKSAEAIEWFMNNTRSFCEEELKDVDYTRNIKNERYDVAIAEYYDLCAFYHFHYARIPSIILTSSSTYPDIVSEAWGVPLVRSYTPFMSSLQSINIPFMNYKERLLTLLLDFATKRPFHNFQESIQKLAESHYHQPMPKFTELLRSAKYLFVNQHEMMDHPRPITNKFRAIGGITMFQPKKLTPEIEAIMQKGKSGVIIFTLGSMLEMNLMPIEIKRAVLETMTMFPDHVLIWRITPDEETRQMIAKYPNVFAVKWIDQLSVLADPRTKAFISHCGNNGMMEAAFSGVPNVLIPLVNDQHYIASIALQRGTGVYLDRLKISKGTLTNALRSVLFDEKYAKNAQKLKEKLRNHPVNSAEMFVRHVEYSTTFESNDEMHLAAIHLNTITYYNLDIYAPIVVFVILILYSTYKFIRSVRSLFRRMFAKLKRE